MSKEEFTAHRERELPFQPRHPWEPVPFIFHLSPVVEPSLTDLYDDLSDEPCADVPCSEKIGEEIKRLAGKDDMKSWKHLSSEDKWVLQLYGDDCLDAFGGLEIWCGEHVPQEVLKIVRGVAWDADDDLSSVSDMTEA
jgi:hypothetical protein